MRRVELLNLGISGTLDRRPLRVSALARSRI